jgi:hypothetical protein
VIKVVAGRGEAPGWRLVSRTGLGADILAPAVTGTEPAAWQRGVERLRDGDGTLSVVRTLDGHFKWVLVGLTGALIAESPPIYRDSGDCRRAFADAQHAARAAIGSDRNRRARTRTDAPASRQHTDSGS